MTLLKIDKLSVEFGSSKKDTFRALDKVSLELNPGEVLGIVGESGSGKSTLIRSVLQLQRITSGVVLWKGQDVATFHKLQQLEFKKSVQMIFQDPLDALNPRMPIAQIIEEPLIYLKPELTKQQRLLSVSRMMQAVGLSADQANRFPHEFSGGQCQRIGIARAMIVEPQLLVCDEPVSALDVSIQAQIINLLLELKQRTEMSMIFISHDLSVVRHLCDQVLVLQEGKVMEVASIEDLFTSPKNDYTKRLLESIPHHDPDEERQRILTWGSVSNPAAH